MAVKKAQGKPLSYKDVKSGVYSRAKSPVKATVANKKDREQGVYTRAKPARPAGSSTYKIKKGDTLRSLAKKTYGDEMQWKRIYNANKDTVKNPDLIFAGKTLRIPGTTGSAGKAATKAAAPKAPAAKPQPKKTAPSTTTTRATTTTSTTVPNRSVGPVTGTTPFNRNKTFGTPTSTRPTTTTAKPTTTTRPVAKTKAPTTTKPTTTTAKPTTTTTKPAMPGRRLGQSVEGYKAEQKAKAAKAARNATSTTKPDDFFKGYLPGRKK